MLFGLSMVIIFGGLIMSAKRQGVRVSPSDSLQFKIRTLKMLLVSLLFSYLQVLAGVAILHMLNDYYGVYPYVHFEWAHVIYVFAISVLFDNVQTLLRGRSLI